MTTHNLGEKQSKTHFKQVKFTEKAPEFSKLHSENIAEFMLFESEKETLRENSRIFAPSRKALANTKTGDFSLPSTYT